MDKWSPSKRLNIPSRGRGRMGEHSAVWSIIEMRGYAAVEEVREEGSIERFIAKNNLPKINE